MQLKLTKRCMNLENLKKSWDANQSVTCPFTFSKNWHIGTEIILNHVFHIQNVFI